MNAINLKRDWMFIISAVLLFVYAFSYPVLKLWMFCLFGGVFVIFNIIKQKRVVIDNQVMLLVMAMIIIAAHDAQYQLEGEVYKFLAPIVAYMLGTLWLEKDDPNDSKAVTGVMMLGCGMYLQAAIDMLFAYRELANGELASGWTGIFNIFMARTAYMSNYLMFLGVFFYFLVKYKEQKDKYNLRKLIIVSVMVALSIINSLLVRGRMVILDFILTFILLTIIYIVENRSAYIKGITKKHLLIGAGVVCVAVLLLIICKIILSSNEDLFLNRDGGILHNIRFQVALQGLQLLIANPNGGFITTIDPDITTTHNMWLEYGREFGLGVFIILVFHNLLILKDIVICCSKKIGSVKYLIIGAFISLNVFFWFEPIQSISDSSQIWIFSLILAGMLRHKVQSEYVAK